MKHSTNLLRTFTRGALALWLGWTASTQANLLVDFPFNEGSGTNVADTAQGLQGYFGFRQDPAAGAVTLTAFSPSGLPGDNSVTTTGNGFLMVDDSVSPVLAITNGPITIECWLYIDPLSATRPVEGLVGYGNSYKLGLKGGRQVFTLFGIADITNTAPVGVIPAAEWVHVATAWEPGVGVHFYVNGVSNFTAYTALAARPPWNNYLSLGAQHYADNIVGSLDRVRIHHALLTADDLDSDAANPKAPLASTLVAYNFNETDFPCDSAVAPSRPTQLWHEVVPNIGAPVWTADTPTGMPGDYALSFNATSPLFRERISVNYEGGELIPLGVNNTNYTLEAWVKLPPSDGIEDRRVIFRGPTNAPRVSMSVHVTRTMHTTLFGNKDFDSPVQIPNDNRWHHLAVVMEDFARMKFYLDGIHRFTTNRTAAGVPNAAAATPNVLIGLENDARYYKGLLDRVRIHNVALTDSQLDFPAIPGQAMVTSHPVDVMANAGDTAVFSATVSSPTAAAYQWHFRTNRADWNSVPVPGATSTTLTLPDVAAGHQGFYFLMITNDVGVSESYGARLMVGTAPLLDLGGFELPQYKSGPIEDQDFWSNDQNGNVVRILTAAEIEAALTAAGLTPGDTVQGGSQAMVVSGTGLATASVRPVLGFENEQQVTLDVWVRPLVRGTTAMVTNNVFLTIENSAGTRAAAFRFGPSLRIDYNSGNAWVATGATWDPTGSTWYRITMVLDYTTRTYDFLLNGTKVNTNPLPFYFNTSDSFRQIRIFRGANNAGMILDNLTVTVPESAPELGIRKDGVSLVIFWPATVTDYELKSANAVEAAPETWTTVPHTTVGDEHQAVIAPTENSQFFRLVK